MVGSSLQIFEIVSTATRAAHFSTLGLLALCGTFLGSLEATRTSEGWLGGSALALCGLACIWALAAGEVVGGITQAYYLQTGVVAHLNVQQAQGKWGRRAKIAFAVLGTTVINILVALLAFNLALRGWDAGLKAPGSRYWVSVSLDPMGNVCLPDANNSLFFESLSSQAQTSHNLRKATFRIHLACEEAPAPAPSASRILGNDDKNKTKTARPTALVMTERGVAGEVGAQWVRDMVARPPRKTENGTDDGHLALERVCFWDRPG